MFLNELFESRYVEPNVTLEQYHQVASLHRLIFPEKVDSGKIDSPQFEKWMEKNFEIRWINDKGGWYRAPKGYICAFNSNEEDFDFNISRVANNNKQTIIKSLLELIKKSQFNVVATYIDNLKDLNWPEFDVIKKSLVLSKPEDDDDDFDPEEIFEERKFRRRAKPAEAFEKYGVDWPELNIIKKSFDPAQHITESKDAFIYVTNAVTEIILNVSVLLLNTDSGPPNLAWAEENFGVRRDAARSNRRTQWPPRRQLMTWVMPKEQFPTWKRKLCQIADDNKKVILSNLLRDIKIDWEDEWYAEAVDDLISIGLQWPELQIIKKSLGMEAGKITEALKRLP